MILYHGTNISFDIIDLSKCRPNKDFDQGFYLTSIESQAIDMAQRRCNFDEAGSPIVQRYEWDENNDNLQVLIFEGVSVEWAEFIVKTETERITSNTNTTLLSDQSLMTVWCIKSTVTCKISSP